MRTVEPLFALHGKANHPFFHRIERVVFAPLHVFAREPLGAPLAHQNLAWPGLLAVRQLNPKILRLGMSS